MSEAWAGAPPVKPKLVGVTASSSRVRLAVHLLVTCAGFAALSWEVIWQLKAALAVGVSAVGTAITLATTMGGMSAGSLLCGRWLRGRTVARPLRYYAMAELVIGFSGLLLGAGFSLLEHLDTQVYASAPGLASLAHCMGIALLLGPPTVAMGATIPILGLVAQSCGARLPRLYGLNTAGAAFGCLYLSFSLLPSLGVSRCCLAVAGLNFLVAAVAFALAGAVGPTVERAAEPSFLQREAFAGAEVAVFLTGLVTFGLEVAWFRAIRAVLRSTSESFAIMLASVLIALAIGAHLAPLFRRRGFSLHFLVGLAGVAVLLATPALERLSLFAAARGGFWHVMLSWFASTFAITGPPMILVGLVLPWLLDIADDPRQWSRLYFLNTLGAVCGSLATAWLVLPALGLTRTSWVAGLLLVGFALVHLLGAKRLTLAVAGASALLLAVTLDTGIGTKRILGRFPFPSYTLVSSVETPDASISLIETSMAYQAVVIDGFVAADTKIDSSHYMSWMGRLPMLLHPNPKSALVICFGTGQTTNAVRREGPEHLDIVDLNRRVLELGPRIRANENVLADARVRPVVMDGRAWMRRSRDRYDVITLEPMPPNFSGVNSLYSREFYQAARAHLNPGGVIAQWLPFHLVPTYHSASIAATFRETFPNSALWLDPVGFTGILVGTTGEQPIASRLWGYEREIPRDLTGAQVARAFALDAAGMERLGALGQVITDDNQLLNHHHWLLRRDDQGQANLAIVNWCSSDPPPPDINPQVLFKKMQVKPEELLPIPPFVR